MKRKLILSSLPVLVFGVAVLLVSSLAPPITTLFSDSGYFLPNHFYFHYSVSLAPGQRGEVQFSSSQPLNFYLLDQINYNNYATGQTKTALVTSSGELHNTHTFTANTAGNYTFILENTSGADAGVIMTFRHSITDLGIVGASLLIFAGAVAFAGVIMKTSAVEDPSDALQMIRTLGRVRVLELALRLSTTESDIQLAVIRLRMMGEPVLYNPATGEVSYNPHPRRE